MTTLRFYRLTTGFLRSAIACLAIVVALSGESAWSQTPRTTRIVVPFPPGGTADVLTRLLAEQIGKTQGQTILIENRPGAGTVIGTEAVARATPDGSTLLMHSNSFVINPSLRKVSYDPLTTFEAVCYLVISPQVIVVNGASPYRTLADLLDDARARPGELSLASVGPATTQHIAFEQLKRLANVNLTYVPYPGGAPAINALLGGHVTVVLQNYSEAVEQLNAGKLRALATASLKRIEPLPNVPTVAESGYNGFQAEAWFGIVAPAKTPKETIAQIADWFSAALQAPEIKAKLVALGLYPAAACGAEYGAYIRQRHDEYARAIREANIKGE